MCNAIAKVTDNEGQVHRFHVNKEVSLIFLQIFNSDQYLSMHSETLARMFDNQGFVEGATGEVEFKSVSRETFQEFLSSIYPSRYRPQGFNFTIKKFQFFKSNTSANCSNLLAHGSSQLLLHCVSSVCWRQRKRKWLLGNA